MDKMKLISNIADEFAKLDYVESVVLSGSQTGLINDKRSDYDMYVYSTKPIPLDFRNELAKKFADNYEVGNTFFEDGDELTIIEDKEHIGVDIMYRNPDWVRGEIDWVWKKHNAKVGYTTCFFFFLKTSKILFDRNGEFQKFIDELNTPFPKELKENIIAKNYPLLREKNASYYEQIEFAIARNDMVSQNHRTAALLASYFDILFAINDQTHPGEKKLVAYSEKLCKLLPKDFKNDIENVIKSISTDKLLCALDKLLDELDIILK